jgi:hypothetical protein
MSSTLAHPYRDPQYRLPPELPLERSSSGGRRGWLVASLAAHVTIVLLVIYPAELQKVDPPREPPGVSTRVDLRHVVHTPVIRYHRDPVGCRGPERSEVTEAEAVALAAPPRPLVVAPRVLHRLRISGETQIAPRRDGVAPTRPLAKVCIDTDGKVTSAAVLISSRCAPYDGAAQAVCSVVTMPAPD